MLKETTVVMKDAYVLADAAAQIRFKALGQYLLSQPEGSTLLVEDDIAPDGRMKSDYNLPLIVRVSVIWLLRELDTDTVDEAVLKEATADYHANPRSEKVHIRVPESMVIRVDKIIAHFDRLGIEIKPRSRRGSPNRQAVLSIAVMYAYHRIPK